MPGLPDRGSDPVIWAPRGWVREYHGETLLHECRQAVVAKVVTRAELDYMALGVCRFCGSAMPGGAK